MMNKSIARSEEKRAASGHREPMPGTDTAVVVEESGKGGDE